ncbi:hypothetical protein Patl1_14773 [Pistacia atlantica]|uniref:Uncharacterized protein n=1 Tax=Pistacia atlantica TaxID=434234 RepID=A0ACC1AXQ4_9ROSI|nr:hypothetical protein Patl1_14773 [Pistacia atlantica]
MATITKDDQQNDPNYDLKEDDNEDNEDEDKDKDGKLLLSQEDVNNFMAKLLFKRNRQFIGHRLHPTAVAIKIEGQVFPLTTTTSTQTTAITPSRTIRTTAITKDDQQSHLKYDLKDDNEDEDKDDKNSRTSLDALWIRLIDRVDGFVVNKKMQTSHSL